MSSNVQVTPVGLIDLNEGRPPRRLAPVIFTFLAFFLNLYFLMSTSTTSGAARPMLVTSGLDGADSFAAAFLTVGFLTEGRFAAASLGGAFLAEDFFLAVFFGAAFFAAVFLAVLRFATFFAGLAFLAALVFFTVFVFLAGFAFAVFLTALFFATMHLSLIGNHRVSFTTRNCRLRILRLEFDFERYRIARIDGHSEVAGFGP